MSNPQKVIRQQRLALTHLQKVLLHERTKKEKLASKITELESEIKLLYKFTPDANCPICGVKAILNRK